MYLVLPPLELKLKMAACLCVVPRGNIPAVNKLSVAPGPSVRRRGRVIQRSNSWPRVLASHWPPAPWSIIL